MSVYVEGVVDPREEGGGEDNALGFTQELG